VFFFFISFIACFCPSFFFSFLLVQVFFGCCEATPKEKVRVMDSGGFEPPASCFLNREVTIFLRHFLIMQLQNYLQTLQILFFLFFYFLIFSFFLFLPYFFVSSFRVFYFCACSFFSCPLLVMSFFCCVFFLLVFFFWVGLVLLVFFFCCVLFLLVLFLFVSFLFVFFLFSAGFSFLQERKKCLAKQARYHCATSPNL